VYTGAVSSNPTFTNIFAHKIFYFKELGAEWRKILKHYFKRWRVRAVTNKTVAQGRTNGRECAQLSK
jgi:hypothetical protein